MQYPQQPYPPTQPPKRNAWQRFRTLGCGWQSLIGCMSICVLVFFAVLCPFAASSFVHGWNAASITPTVAPTASVASQSVVRITTHTPTPKSKPKPTATSDTIPATSAVLGGEIVAFDNKIGSNNCCQDNGWSDGNTQVDVYGVTSGPRWYQVGGERSAERVSGIHLQLYNNGTWATISDAQKAIAPYLPPDAHLVQSFSNGEYEYKSAMLTHTLPASAFIDANSRPETPGLFFAYYHQIGSNPVDYCELATDRGFQNEVPLPLQ